MMDILTNIVPIIEIAASIATVLGVIITVIAQFHMAPQYGLDYYPIQGYIRDPKIQKKLKKYSFSHPVNGLYVVFLELHNYGATPIETKEFHHGDPIIFEFEKNVCDFIFVDTNPPHNQGKYPHLEIDGKMVKIPPGLLRSDERISFLVTFLENCGEIQLYSDPTINVKKIVRRHRLREALSKYLPRIQEGFEWLLAVLCIGIFVWVWLFDHNISIYFLAIISLSVVIVFVVSILRKYG